MAGLSSPFGLGYGLGQAAGQIVPGLQRGQAFAQQQALGQVQVEEAQRGLAQQKALDEALSQEPSTMGEGGKPVDEQGNAYPTQYHQYAHDTMKRAQYLRSKGMGTLASKLEQQAMDMYGRGQGMLSQNLIRSAMLGDTNAVGSGMKQLGFNYDKLEPYTNENGDLAGYTVAAGGHEVDVPLSTLSLVGADPTHAAQYLHQMAGRVYTAQQKSADLDTRLRSQMDQLQFKTGSQERIALGHDNTRKEVARIMGATRMGLQNQKEAAKIQEARALLPMVFENNPELYKIEDPQERDQMAMALGLSRIIEGKQSDFGSKAKADAIKQELNSLTKQGEPSSTSKEGQRVAELRQQLRGLGESASKQPFKYTPQPAKAPTAPVPSAGGTTATGMGAQPTPRKMPTQPRGGLGKGGGQREMPSPAQQGGGAPAPATIFDKLKKAEQGL